jgi:hypothetical protein
MQKNIRCKKEEEIMDLKFARTDINTKPKKAELEKIEAAVEKEESVIFYFDRENSHKDLLELQDYFEGKGKSFYMNEVKYGLSDNEYMYQVHIIN